MHERNQVQQNIPARSKWSKSKPFSSRPVCHTCLPLGIASECFQKVSKKLFFYPTLQVSAIIAQSVAPWVRSEVIFFLSASQRKRVFFSSVVGDGWIGQVKYHALQLLGIADYWPLARLCATLFLHRSTICPSAGNNSTKL